MFKSASKDDRSAIGIRTISPAALCCRKGLGAWVSGWVRACGPTC